MTIILILTVVSFFFFILLVSSIDLCSTPFRGPTQKSITRSITKFDPTKQISFSFKTFDNVPSQKLVTLLSVTIQQSYVDFSPVQISGEDLPNALLFHVLLTCYIILNII